MGFSLALYPIAYRARYRRRVWREEYIEQPHKTPAEEAALSAEELGELNARRNEFAGVPLVNYTTQYGMGCFEGLKAFPQKGPRKGPRTGREIKLFRPDENAARFASSMKGLGMPGFPEELFVRACTEVTARNAALGSSPPTSPEWEQRRLRQRQRGLPPALLVRRRRDRRRDLREAERVHRRQSGGLLLQAGLLLRVTSERIRATPNGTGWIKCDANYVISALAKKEAENSGYMEVLFLDARDRRYVEEGSSCNAFFFLKSGELVTPELGDTVLPGITRKSVIELARAKGVKVNERRIAIEEVLADAKEVFFTGTAAGVTFVESDHPHRQEGGLRRQGGRAHRGSRAGAQGDTVRGRRRYAGMDEEDIAKMNERIDD